ncbi:formate dehydrogenase [Schlegelella sp. ID0723]|uniref:Formate dehydrogenase n=1 Tax=Piscinibacter koreensis TaxID=2742824 RepID=A0A7Y6NPA2_9BURK|nr:formate dehydrogenase [Schlegelella koreensis]
MVVGAGVAGAAALAAQVLPTGAAAPTATAAAELPSTAAGYRLSAHVKRYYETTKA